MRDRSSRREPESAYWPRYDNNPRSPRQAQAVATQAKPSQARGNIGWFLMGLTVSMATMLVLFVGLVQSQAITVPFYAVQTAAQVATATPPPPAPTAIPTQVPIALQAQLNAHAGCANGPVKPMAQIIWTGRNPAVTTPTPNEVALTFDDGPTPYTTPPILDYLEQSHTPATFFVEGSYAALWPDLVRREWHDGFPVGMHTWDHPNMTLQSDHGLQHQFADTLKAVQTALGTNACVWLWRPPYGSYNMHVVNFGTSLGLTTITWDTDSLDWTTPGTDAIVARVLRLAHPGAIILMHDGPANREETAQALPQIVAGLKALGLTPVTVPQLLVDAHFTGLATAPISTPTP